MDKFYFENTQGNYNKFWAIELEEQKDDNWHLIRRWGKIGQEGRTMIESYHSFTLASCRKDSLIKEKIEKGYKAVL